MEWLIGMIIVTGVLIFLFLILLIYNPKRRKKISWMSGLFCHRGYHDLYTYPENSLGAIKKAVDHHYGIEFDVVLTGDKQVVVFHDKNLQRMCNQSLEISECTYHQLKQHTLYQSNEKIPLLSEVLQIVNGKVPLAIEIKCHTSNYASLCIEVEKILCNYHGNFAICSFNPFVLRYFRKHFPNYLRGQISENFKSNSRLSFLMKFLLRNLLLNWITRPDFISYCYPQINISLRINRLLGCKICGWTIRSEEERKKYEKFYNVIMFELFDPVMKSEE